MTDRTALKDFALLGSTRASQLAWFLGAGASAAAGIPTGYDMILDFKARLFCAELNLPRREIDVGDPLWAERIESYFDDAHGLPAQGSPGEYAAAFEKAFPAPRDRRRYIEEAIRKGVPSFGHRVLATMIVNRLTPAIFTPNFDSLVEESATQADALMIASEQVRLAVADLNRVDVAVRCLRDSSWPLLCKLHGDYQSERLKNIGGELAAQDEQLRQVFVGACTRFGIVVVGYSGRDTSVMEALDEVARTPNGFPGGLFWVMRPGERPLPAVNDLLEAATAHGKSASFVEADTFDELAGALEGQLDLPPALGNHVRAARTPSRVQLVTLPTDSAERFPVLRTSALPVVSMPSSARRIILRTVATTADLRVRLRASGVRWAAVACLGREVAAFGRDDELLAAFADLNPRLEGEVTLDPAAGSWTLGLLYEALIHALARGQPLRMLLDDRRGHGLRTWPPNNCVDHDWARQQGRRLEPLRGAYREAIAGTVPTLGAPYAEAAAIRLEDWLGQWWCVLEPYTWIQRPRSGVSDAQEDLSVWSRAAADWRRERWAQRYNDRWNEIIAGWARLLVAERTTQLHLAGTAPGMGVDATFELHQVTGWARPGGTFGKAPGQG